MTSERPSDIFIPDCPYCGADGWEAGIVSIHWVIQPEEAELAGLEPGQVLTEVCAECARTAASRAVDEKAAR